MPVARWGGGERRGRRAPRLNAVREHQDLWLLVRITRTGTRMPLDHSLGSEEGLDLFAQERNAFRLLSGLVRFEKLRRRGEKERD